MYMTSYSGQRQKRVCQRQHRQPSRTISRCPYLANFGLLSRTLHVSPGPDNKFRRLRSHAKGTGSQRGWRVGRGSEHGQGSLPRNRPGPS